VRGKKERVGVYAPCGRVNSRKRKFYSVVSFVLFVVTYTAMLQQAANNVYAKDSIGGAPICGVLPQWFVDEFEKFVALKPEAAGWNQRQIENTMANLWVLDPEDLI
jgi:hypothetical protein